MRRRYKRASQGLRNRAKGKEEMIKMQDDQYPFATISVFKNVKLGD